MLTNLIQGLVLNRVNDFRRHVELPADLLARTDRAVLEAKAEPEDHLLVLCESQPLDPLGLEQQLGHQLVVRVHRTDGNSGPLRSKSAHNPQALGDTPSCCISHVASMAFWPPMDKGGAAEGAHSGEREKERRWNLWGALTGIGRSEGDRLRLVEPDEARSVNLGIGHSFWAALNPNRSKVWPKETLVSTNRPSSVRAGRAVAYARPSSSDAAAHARTNLSSRKGHEAAHRSTLERRGRSLLEHDMSMPSRPAVAADVTAWFRRDTPLRRFLRTQTGSGTILLAGVAAALVWANVDFSSYERVWQTTLSVHLGNHGVSMDLRDWINSGLMTFFFLLVGLEARREFDIGEFRDRPRIVLPVLAALGGMAFAIGLYISVNIGQPSVHGWGAAMTTDTALALGALALLGQRAPSRLRGFILTLTIADDIVGLIVIAVVYSDHVDPAALVVGAAFLAMAVVASRIFLIHSPFVYVALGGAAWLAVENSGVDPVVVGLAIGIIAYAAPASRRELESITTTFRNFREQPTPVLSARVRQGLRRSISPNDRLQQFWTPWSSYVIVPLFALANAGIAIDPHFLASAYTSKITLGIMAAYVLGKPAGIVVASGVIARVSRGRLRPPVGWLAVSGAGTVAGIGFTVSLLVASIAFSDDALKEATLGVLSAAVLSAGLSQIIFRAGARLPEPVRRALLLEGSDVIVDLADPVDPERDHVRGPAEAAVTLVEYGDFECPFCGKAEPVVRRLLADFGDLRYVWRHLPLTDVHPHAQLAAEAAEAAGGQGAFWAMHDLLLDHQGNLTSNDLLHYAEQLELDTDRFLTEMESGAWSERIAADVESADLSGAVGTPSFFVNGQRQPGPFDLEHLSAAIRVA